MSGLGPDGEEADLGRPYILGIGTLEPRKNLQALAEAGVISGDPATIAARCSSPDDHDRWTLALAHRSRWPLGLAAAGAMLGTLPVGRRATQSIIDHASPA